MARNKVRLDTKGIEEIAKSRPMQYLVRGAASDVAKNVNAQGIVAESGAKADPRYGTPARGSEVRAEVEVDVTDRARATVVVKHPAAEALQAKRGLLTKAAAQSGLEVKDKR